MKCAVCGAEGFAPSTTGDGCTFCDGTEGGNPPEAEIKRPPGYILYAEQVDAREGRPGHTRFSVSKDTARGRFTYWALVPDVVMAETSYLAAGQYAVDFARQKLDEQIARETDHG